MELNSLDSAAEPAVTDQAPKPAVTVDRPSTLPKLKENSPTVDDNPNGKPESILVHGGNRGAQSCQIPTASGSKAVPSDEFQAGINVRSWLLELSDISPLGLAGSLFEAILNLYTAITQQAARAKHSRRLHSELERFFLWGDCFSASDGRLDEVLSKSSELRHTVLSTLYELGKVVKDSLLRVFDVSSRSEGPDGSAESVSTDHAQVAGELQRLLEKTATVLDAPEATTDFESLSDDGFRRYDLDEILNDIAVYIDCLMDLSLALESPVVDLEHGDNSHQEVETFDVSSSRAAAFCRRIRDRFPNVPKFLIERLGETNAARVVQLEALQERVAEQEQVKVTSEPEESSYQISEQILSASQPRTTTTSDPYWTQQSDSIFEMPQLVPLMSRKTVDPEESRSYATFASFSTSFSAISEGRRRVPPLPEEAADGRPFTCLACHQTLTGITSRAAWKKHIFDDLQPYLCTIQSCTETKVLFSSSQAWAAHEATHRKKDWTVSTCLFCDTKSSKNLSDTTKYYKHVGEHMREISLAVLPQNLDEDEEVSDSQAEEVSTHDDIGSIVGGAQYKNNDNGTQSVDSRRKQRRDSGRESNRGGDKYGLPSHNRNRPAITDSPSSGGYKETLGSDPPRRHDYDVQSMESNLISPNTSVARNPISPPAVSIQFPTLNRSRQQQTLSCPVTIEAPDNKGRPDPDYLRPISVPQFRPEDNYARPPSPTQNTPRFYSYESPEMLEELTRSLHSRVKNWHGLDFSRFGKLHLYGTIKVGKDLALLQELECFLFAEMLICIKEKSMQANQQRDNLSQKNTQYTLKGSILIKKHLSEVIEIQSDEGSVPLAKENILTLSLSVAELPCFHLKFNTHNQLKLWQQVLLDFIESYAQTPSPEVLEDMTRSLYSRVENWHGLDFSRFGKLRLYGTIKVGKDLALWQELECFLFAEMLICVKEKIIIQADQQQWDNLAQKNIRCTIKGSILLKKHLSEVIEIQSDEGSVPLAKENILTLSLSVAELPCFHLKFNTHNQLKLWQQALTDLITIERSPTRSLDSELSKTKEEE